MLAHQARQKTEVELADLGEIPRQIVVDAIFALDARNYFIGLRRDHPCVEAGLVHDLHNLGYFFRSAFARNATDLILRHLCAQVAHEIG